MQANKLKILIATGIYPPDAGGPAQYAKNLEDVWKSKRHDVRVRFFSFEKKLPTGLRHLFYFIKVLPSVLRADYILVLDTFSVALPVAIACFISRKKFIIRTGGDFLWESYVERTGDQILFKDFYALSVKFSVKERCVFYITKWVLRHADRIVFSTNWQKHEWLKAYNISEDRTVIIENCYSKPTSSGDSNKVFFGPCRNLKWKNLETLRKIFNYEQIKNSGYVLDLDLGTYQSFIERLKKSYAFVLVSLGDISPNVIMQAIQYGKPFIVTKEIGIYDRIKDVAIFVDPLDENDIREKVLWLLEEKNYKVQKEKILSFNFTHSWEDIADELIKLNQ